MAALSPGGGKYPEKLKYEVINKMRKINLRKNLLVVMVMLAISTASSALIAEGDPIDIDSWAQRFQESGVGNFNEIEVIWLTGPDGFKPPVFRNFNKAGWSNNVNSQWYAKATGSTQTVLQFNIAFDGSRSDTFSFLFRAAENGVTKEVAKATWNNGWTFEVLDEAAWNAMGVPSQCSDGIDNDGDGAIDYLADCGCNDPSDNDESDCCTNCAPEPITTIAAIAVLAPVLGYGLVRRRQKQN